MQPLGGPSVVQGVGVEQSLVVETVDVEEDPEREKETETGKEEKERGRKIRLSCVPRSISKALVEMEYL